MSQVYQLKITLMGSKPPIWRRFTVDSGITLGDLHYIIQEVMGWMNDHLHEYISAEGDRYGMDNLDNSDFDEIISENEIHLCDVIIREKQKLFYCYDFGDDWRHQLVLEKVIEVPEKHPRPRCLKGKNACPPEDCGGIWGYYNLLQILDNPEHPHHEEMLEWTGGGLDPELFDIDLVNHSIEE